MHSEEFMNRIISNVIIAAVMLKSFMELNDSIASKNNKEEKKRFANICMWFLEEREKSYGNSACKPSQ